MINIWNNLKSSIEADGYTVYDKPLEQASMTQKFPIVYLFPTREVRSVINLSAPQIDKNIIFQCTVQDKSIESLDNNIKNIIEIIENTNYIIETYEINYDFNTSGKIYVGTISFSVRSL